MPHFNQTYDFPSVLTTAVGSLPHTDPEEAADLVLKSLPGVPHVPQLSRRDPREQMWIQFTENLPCFQVDLENLKYGFHTSGDHLPQIEEFYTHYLAITDGGPADFFAVSPEYGQGIHTFLERLRQEARPRPFVKVQVTGPLSFALSVADETGRPIFYHPMFRDVAVKGMGLKAIWLLEQFQPFAEQVIVFFDEPSLAAYGSSAFLGVSREDVLASLDEVTSMVTARGGIPGVHCCGNTDWGLLMETTTRIVNFDAVDYAETVAIYAQDVSRFLERGGVLAWGAVSNTESIRTEALADVVRRVQSGMALLEARGVDGTALRQTIMITPACGCAGLSVKDTALVYRLLSELDTATVGDIAPR